MIRFLKEKIGWVSISSDLYEEMIVYKMTDEWYIERQRVTTSGTTSGTTSDNDDNEW